MGDVTNIQSKGGQEQAERARVKGDWEILYILNAQLTPFPTPTPTPHTITWYYFCTKRNFSHSLGTYINQIFSFDVAFSHSIIECITLVYEMHKLLLVNGTMNLLRSCFQEFNNLYLRRVSRVIELQLSC